MITDKTALAAIQNSWKGVELLRQKLQIGFFASASQGAVSFSVVDAAHNLPFVHACAVLNDALEQLRDEQCFNCGGKHLGALLDASNGKLPWRNFQIIKEAVQKRNDIAHRAEILPRAECWRYMDAIKDELRSLNIIQPTATT